MTKEEYYEYVLHNRKLMEDESLKRCPCPNPLCDWHGRCRECVALHRHYDDHIPHCLQPIIQGSIQALAGAVELRTDPKEGRPVEYRRYVKERDQEKDAKP